MHGTDHHQWLSNEVVVAMVTRLYKALPTRRPCPAPRRFEVCDRMCVCVSLTQPCYHASPCLGAGVKAESQDWRVQAVIRWYQQWLWPDPCPFSGVWQWRCHAPWLSFWGRPSDDAPWVATCLITKPPALAFFFVQGYPRYPDSLRSSSGADRKP